MVIMANDEKKQATADAAVSSEFGEGTSEPILNNGNVIGQPISSSHLPIFPYPPSR